MFTIEKSIPFAAAAGNEFSAALASLEVGESFLFQRTTATAYYTTRANKDGTKKFRTRKANETQYRVWRIA